MWNPTKTSATISSSETSDNKNKENTEACSCSCSGGSGSGSAFQQDSSCRTCSCLHKSHQQQQQTLNNFETNSKNQQKLTFGGNLSKPDSSSIEPQADPFSDKSKDYESETIDSGFISGPQNSSNFLDEPESEQRQNFDQNQQEGAVGGGVASTNPASANITQYNIHPQVPQQRHQKQQQQHQPKDSGCIDSESSDCDDVNDEAASAKATNDKKITEVESAKALQLRTIQTSRSDQSNSSSTKTTQDVPMILKNKVENSVSDMFNNLSLQSDSSNTGGMNNLNSNNGRRYNTTDLHVRTKRCAPVPSPPPSSSPAPAPAKTAGPGLTITPSNAWEQYFQQNDDGDTPLHLAVICGRVEVVVGLLRIAPHPCLFNIQNDEAQTPLHLAARTSQPNIIRMLLLAGAEPTIRDRDGNTALHLACINAEIQCVRTLLEAFTHSEIVEAHRQYGHLSNDKLTSSLNYARLPSDLEIRNYDGERCVHLVARNGNIDILRLLVRHGADINAREGRSGLTPLHIAIECCNEKLANFLLDECEKLNVETATYAGLTAYQVACMLNKSQLQTMLENYGAEPLTPPDSDYDSSDIEDLDDSKFYERFGDPGYFVGYSGGNPMTVA